MSTLLPLGFAGNCWPEQKEFQLRHSAMETKQWIVRESISIKLRQPMWSPT